MSLILSSSCWFSLSPPDASACRTAICSSSVPGFPWHIPCTSLNSSSFPLFHSLCLSDHVFACIHPFFSRQGSLNDRSDALSASVIMWFCHFPMRCKRCTSWAASNVSVSFNVRRQDGESSGFILCALFQPQSLAMEGPFLSLSAVTFFVNFNSEATNSHRVPHKPSQFNLPRTTPFLVVKKTFRS